MEDLLKTSTVDEEGFIDIGNGNKVKAEDLKIAVDANRKIEKDLISREVIANVYSRSLNPFKAYIYKGYLERIRNELGAMEDGHVSYSEASTLKEDVSTLGMGVSLFEHWNMREVLNKSWEFENMSSKNITDFITSVKNEDFTTNTFGEVWGKIDFDKAVYHSPDGSGKDIFKFVSESGREVVFDIDQTGALTDPMLLGTYNYSKMGHLALDMSPYWKWSNNAMDTSVFNRRLHPVFEQPHPLSIEDVNKNNSGSWGQRGSF